MISLQKTKHSEFIREFFVTRKNRGLNILANGNYLAKQLISQGYDEDLNNKTLKLFHGFLGFLSHNKLKLVYFAVGYNEKIEKYTFVYVVRSLVHNNADFRSECVMEDSNVPFVFLPQVFSSYLSLVLTDIKLDELRKVARGE